MKRNSIFMTLVCVVLTAVSLVVGARMVDSGQTEPEETILKDTAGLIELTDAHTRCGKYFVLETHSFTGFDVKQVHVVLPIESNVALVSLYYSDIETVLDESKDTPVLVRMKDESGREKDVVRLSSARFGEAKACLPPPDES